MATAALLSVGFAKLLEYSMEGTVEKVYYFTVFDITTGENKQSKRPATMVAITQLGGVPLLHTEQEVDPRQVDLNGFYQPA